MVVVHRDLVFLAPAFVQVVLGTTNTVQANPSTTASSPVSNFGIPDYDSGPLHQNFASIPNGGHPYSVSDHRFGPNHRLSSFDEFDVDEDGELTPSDKSSTEYLTPNGSNLSRTSTFDSVHGNHFEDIPYTFRSPNVAPTHGKENGGALSSSVKPINMFEVEGSSSIASSSGNSHREDPNLTDRWDRSGHSSQVFHYKPNQGYRDPKIPFTRSKSQDGRHVWTDGSISSFTPNGNGDNKPSLQDLITTSSSPRYQVSPAHVPPMGCVGPWVCFRGLPDVRNENLQPPVDVGNSKKAIPQDKDMGILVNHVDGQNQEGPSRISVAGSSLQPGLADSSVIDNKVKNTSLRSKVKGWLSYRGNKKNEFSSDGNNIPQVSSDGKKSSPWFKLFSKNRKGSKADKSNDELSQVLESQSPKRLVADDITNSQRIESECGDASKCQHDVEPPVSRPLVSAMKGSRTILEGTPRLKKQLSWSKTVEILDGSPRKGRSSKTSNQHNEDTSHNGGAVHDKLVHDNKIMDPTLLSPTQDRALNSKLSHDAEIMEPTQNNAVNNRLGNDGKDMEPTVMMLNQNTEVTKNGTSADVNEARKKRSRMRWCRPFSSCFRGGEPVDE